MHVAVNGTRIWFDVDGLSLVPDGRRMRERPTLVLVHGGPGGYDHSYFKPHFGHLTDLAQLVYVDLRDHGRSARHDPAEWDFEVCADDLRTFCDVLGIVRPLVFGHSMGGCIVVHYGFRHPGHAAGLILQSTLARFDLDSLTEAFRDVAGDEVAGLARRDYSGHAVTEAEWARVFAAFGPTVPGPDELARRIRNTDLGGPGMDVLRRLDIVDRVAGIRCPALVCAGELDPVTPPAAAREIADRLRDAKLEIVDGAGHFPWLDRPERYWPLIREFIAAARQRGRPARRGGPVAAARRPQTS